MLLIVSLLIDSKKGGELWFLFVLCIGGITFQWQAVIRNHADILFAMLLNFHAVNILIEPFALLLTAVPAILRNIVKMWLQKVHLYIDTRPQAVRNLKLGLELLFFLFWTIFSKENQVFTSTPVKASSKCLSFIDSRIRRPTKISAFTLTYIK